MACSTQPRRRSQPGSRRLAKLTITCSGNWVEILTMGFVSNPTAANPSTLKPKSSFPIGMHPRFSMDALSALFIFKTAKEYSKTKPLTLKSSLGNMQGFMAPSMPARLVNGWEFQLELHFLALDFSALNTGRTTLPPHKHRMADDGQ